jgi:hypothetical protein
MKKEQNLNNPQSQQLNIAGVMPRFHFTRFHVGTDFEGWEIAIFGICLKWMKFLNHKHYTYWRCANFGKIAMWNRSIEFTLPRLSNGT